MTEVRSYAELMAALRARVEAIGAPHDIVEEHAGMVHGHLGKILGRAQDKRMGLYIIWQLFEALGLVMVVHEHLDVEATRDEMGEIYRPTAFFAKRGHIRKQISPAVISIAAREMGARGGLQRKRFRLSPAKRSKINRRNAKRRKSIAAATICAATAPGP